ncbi:CxC2 domain-containing protein [Favolaschia claudopus]|uniref:CxC2 domain-containing protein n=1 Tax=Favolaschia claudopus TaxID=2862362 RepID=A0AAV9ZER3_9AGAR
MSRNRQSLKRKAAEMECQSSHTQFRDPNITKTHFTITSDTFSSTSTRTSILRTLATVPSVQLPPIEQIPTVPEEPLLTRSAQLLEDFEEKFKDLGDLILAYEADPGCGLPCAFWDFEQEFFVRHNISALGHTIQLGHHGGACETPVGGTPVHCGEHERDPFLSTSILSCVDLRYGEKFANADKTLAMELEQHGRSNEEFDFTLRIEVENVDDVTTYDIACEYFINLEERFKTHFPHLVPRLKKMRWGIPALHVQVSDLANEILEAKKKYIEKRNHFIGLSLSFRDRVPKWRTMSRTPSKVGKEAISVYKHKSTKGVTHLSSAIADRNIPENTTIPKTRVAEFMDEGIKIQDLQRKIRTLISDTNEHDLMARRKEISLRSSKLRVRIDKWRKIQQQLCPMVGDKIAGQAVSAPLVHEEMLYLPSDFPSEVEQRTLHLSNLAKEEIRWREGQAFDALRAIQNVVKTISALRGQKIKNDRQQKQNTRAGDNIAEAIKLRDQHMVSYEAARQSLISLNAVAMVLVEELQPEASSSNKQEEAVNPTIGTQMPKRKSGPHKTRSKPVKIASASDDRPEGWLWQLGKLTKMTDAEMDEWSSEGDRVQWFRAEAEMQRWQEQTEQKLAELLRTNRKWSTLGQKWLPRVPSLLEPNSSLVERVKQERKEEAEFIAKAISVSVRMKMDDEEKKKCAVTSDQSSLDASDVGKRGHKLCRIVVVQTGS